MSTIHHPPVRTGEELAAFRDSPCPDDAISRKLLYDTLMHRMAELLNTSEVLAGAVSGAALLTKSMPPVDAVLVVRCADCKRYAQEPELVPPGSDPDYWCSLHRTAMRSDDFCSYGTRTVNYCGGDTNESKQ